MKFTPHHVALTVKNIAESIAWYESMLGFILEREFNKQGMHIALLIKDDFRLELFTFDREMKALPQERADLMEDLHTIGTKHLALLVEDMEVAVKELKSKKVQLSTDVDLSAFGGRFVFFKDCNGILIEMYSEK